VFMTTVAVSGYFNPIHVGHIRLLKAAKELGDKLIVIVNNDKQVMLKKGRIIIPEDQRMEIVQAIRDVDEAVLSIDDDRTVRKTLAMVKPDIFANGGDQASPRHIPETPVCEELSIKMIFGVGGEDKPDSSTNIMLKLEEKEY